MAGLPRTPVAALVLLAAVALDPPAQAESASGAEHEGGAELAQELSKPLADLMSIPFQMNYDRNIGPRNDDWNLISRTIVPVIYQDDIFPLAGSQFGPGDANLSLFVSPPQPTFAGVTWGVRSLP